MKWLLVLAACTGTQQVGERPSWRQGGSAQAVQPAVFAPDTQAVSRYNEPIQAPPSSPLGDSVIAEVAKIAQRVGRPMPIADARLFKACAELAQIYPQDGVIGYDLVEFALQRNGIIEPSPRLLVVWGQLEDTAAIAQQLEPQLPDVLAEGTNLHLGAGMAKRNPDGTGVIVFALQSSSLTTSPIPRAVGAGGAIALSVKVEARYHDPEVFVTHDDGDTQRLPIVEKATSFTSTIPCNAHKGKQQVEITASDTNGSTVLANFPIWCDAEPPTSLTIAPPSREDIVQKPTDAEQKLLVLVNRDRKAAGLGELAWDERVAEVARGHSEEMKRTKIVAHVSPTTGQAQDRVKAANIKTAVVLENVARAYGVLEAHQALMNSPGHRANLMSKVATTIGIGVVFGEEISGGREMFITQVFTRVPPKIDPSQAASIVAKRIVSVSAKLHDSDKLTAIARDVAAQLATGKTREQVWPSVKSRIDALAATYQKIGSVITAAADLDVLDGKALLGDALPDDIGVGIAQGTHPEIGEGAIWIVVLMGTKR